MTQQDLIREWTRRFWRNEPVAERDLYREDPVFFREVLETFDSWHQFEEAMGVTSRLARERERFYLYLTMKDRRRRFGEEALRYKNIETDMKQRIARYFRTVKRLTGMIGEWTPESTLYEVHAYHLTGGTPQQLKHDKPTLHQQVLHHFGDLDSFYISYDKRMRLNVR